MNKLRVIAAALCAAFFSTSAMAGGATHLIGTWKGAVHGAVIGVDTHHEGKNEQEVRFVRTEFTIVIDKVEGQNFSGYHFSRNRKEAIIGAVRSDMKSGVYVDGDGILLFELVSNDMLETCYAHAATHSKEGSAVVSCAELIRQ